jgi:ElaB/YqjD/DUF883 family membrane-anchored ribosome-binding protein
MNTRTATNGRLAATGNKARQAARAADRTVHAHPYGAIGLAAAVGALVGFLAARRG